MSLPIDVINNLEALLMSNKVTYSGADLPAVNRCLLALQRERALVETAQGASKDIPEVTTRNEPAKAE